MAATYESISTTTLSQTTADVTLSNIPQTYTDLVLIIQGKAHYPSSTFISMGIRFNSDSSAVYTYADSASWNFANLGSGRQLNGNQLFANLNANSTNSQETSLSKIDILGYSNTNHSKQVFIRNAPLGEANWGTNMAGGIWRNTNAITSIYIWNSDSGTGFFAGTTFSLYGIKKA